MTVSFFTALRNRSSMDTADMKVYAAFHLTRQDIAAGNDTFVLHHEGWCHEYMAGDEDGCTA